jgi:hypothetical protein
VLISLSPPLPPSLSLDISLSCCLFLSSCVSLLFILFSSLLSFSSLILFSSYHSLLFSSLLFSSLPFSLSLSLLLSLSLASLLSLFLSSPLALLLPSLLPISFLSPPLSIYPSISFTRYDSRTIMPIDAGLKKVTVLFPWLDFEDPALRSGKIIDVMNFSENFKYCQNFTNACCHHSMSFHAPSSFHEHGAISSILRKYRILHHILCIEEYQLLQA